MARGEEAEMWCEKKKKKRNWSCGVNGAIFADVCTFFI